VVDRSARQSRRSCRSRDSDSCQNGKKYALDVLHDEVSPEAGMVLSAI
jgi:hypothetical protein